MTHKRISDAMDGLDTAYLTEALSHPTVAAKRIRAKRLLLRLGSLAACLCLLFTSVFVGYAYFYIPPVPDLPTAEKGIWIPQSPVYGWSSPPSVSCGIAPTYIFYQGQVYYSGRDLGELPRLAIGKKLGTTIGWVDGWTAEDGYEGYDFAGVTAGYPVYTVKGYSPDFMICVKYYNSITKGSQIIAFINVDGFYLEKGADLFDARLRLSTGYKSISYKADPWEDFPRATKPTPTAVDKKTMQCFLDAINAATFLYRQDIPDEARKAGIGTEEICRVYIENTKGLYFPLCLYKGGYVSFLGCVTEIYGTGEKDSLFGLAVKIDDQTFQALIHELHANSQ